jgi:adenylate cyclase
VPLLNDYADALVSAIHGAGGQVLKFIGDGILATFDLGALDGAAEACARARSTPRPTPSRASQHSTSAAAPPSCR